MSRVYRWFRITWKLIKFLFFALVFSVIALLFWRVFSSGDPKSMKALTPNDRLATAYAEQVGLNLQHAGNRGDMNF